MLFFVLAAWEAYICEVCNKRYKTKNSLAVHQSRDCINKKLFRCNSCEKIFKRKEYCKPHLMASPNCGRLNDVSKAFSVLN